MSKKQQKTNVARLMDAAKICYELIPYEVDEKDLSAIHVAESLNENIDQVFKTLVLHGDKNGLFVVVIPGNCEVDLKKATKISGNKKVEMIPQKDLLSTTGYIRGGCSPVGMKKLFPTFMHSSITTFDHVFVSAGIRGMQLKIAPNDLISYVKAKVDDLI